MKTMEYAKPLRFPILDVLCKGNRARCRADAKTDGFIWAKGDDRVLFKNGKNDAQRIENGMRNGTHPFCEWEIFAQALRELILFNGSLPSSGWLEKNGYFDIVAAIRHYGGRGSVLMRMDSFLQRHVSGSRHTKYMGQEQMCLLLSGEVLVEEKMDGKTEHFENSDFVVFAEDLKQTHSIRYRIPARYAIFDIYDKEEGVYLPRDAKEDAYRDIKSGRTRLEGMEWGSFFLVDLLAKGIYGVGDLFGIIGISRYAVDERGKAGGEYMEGIVVKRNFPQEPQDALSGKIVRCEFTGGIGENYLRLPYRANIIDPKANETLAR